MLQPKAAPGNWLTPASWPPPLAEVERACGGNQHAAEAIYRAIQPRLNAFLRYQGFDQSTGEDIAAEVSERVLTKIESLRKPETFEAWFWTITRNRVHAWLRRKQRDSKQPEVGMPEPLRPDELYVVGEEHRTVQEALGQLSEQDRHLLWLREVEDLSYREISTIVEASAGAVRVRCHRARQRLKTAYEAVEANRTDPPEPLHSLD